MNARNIIAVSLLVTLGPLVALAQPTLPAVAAPTPGSAPGETSPSAGAAQASSDPSIGEMSLLQKSIDVLKLQVDQAKLKATLYDLSSKHDGAAPATSSIALPPAPGETLRRFPDIANADLSRFRGSVPRIAGIRGGGSHLSATLLLPDGSEALVHQGSSLTDGSKVAAIDLDGVTLAYPSYKKSQAGRTLRLGFIAPPSPTSAARTPAPALMQLSVPTPSAEPAPPSEAAPKVAKGDVKTGTAPSVNE
jgi:type IV pilus biogenesis protein PilP